MGDLPFLMDDAILEDEEIAWAVRRIHLNRSGVPPWMRAEHLRQWLIYATRDDLPDAINWQNVVSIVHAVFRDGTLADECTWQTVFLIPKGRRDFRGIGLVEVLWKALASLLNRRITSSITLQDVLHGFQAGRGMGTATLEEKLLQQLTATREAVLFEVFLELHKSYDDLKCYTCLDIIAGYGVGPRTIQLLWTYWDQLTMMSRAGGYFRRSLKGY